MFALFSLNFRNQVVWFNINFLCLAEFNTLRYFVEIQYKGTFEIDTVTGLMYVPEGAGAKLDYEEVQSYTVEVTVRDRCQTDYCYFGKLAENDFANTILYSQKLIFSAHINNQP